MVATPQLQCSGRFWGTLDFDPCFQQNILNTLVPLLFLFGSSLIFAISAARKTTRRRRAARKVAALDPASSQFTFEHHHHRGRRPSHSRDDYSNRRNPLTRALASILYRLLPWTGPRILPPTSPSRDSAATAGAHPAVPSNGPDRHGISSISVRSSSLAQQRQHGSNSSAHASLAAGEVYRIENGVLLSEVHATPLVRPVTPQTARAQVRAALVKRLLETTASGILVGLSAAALGFRTSWANLAWLAFWIYFTAMLCGYTLVTSHSLWLHKTVLSLAALVIALLNFRTALLAHLALPPTHPEYANSWQVGLHSSQLVFTLLVSGASLLFPYESRPPSKLRAIYQTMQSEQLHASALATVRTTADGVLVEDAAALLAIAPAHDAAVLDVGQPEAPLSKPAALRAALSSPAASTTMTTGEGLNSVRALEASTSSAGEAAALATAQGRIDGATTPFPPGLRNSPSAPTAKAAESSDSDAKEKDQGPVPPEDRASLLSRAFFSFVTPLVRKHYSEQFSLPAVPELSAENRAASVLACFRSGGSPSGSPAEAVEDAGNETSIGRDEVLPLPGPPKESLSWRLLLYFKKDLIFQFAWAVVQAVFELSPAIGLRLILNWIGTRSRAASGHLEEGEELLPLHMAVTYALAMGVGQMVFSIAASQALMRGRKICINLRAILISEIVTKALRRKDVGGQGKKEGEEGEEDGEGGDKKDGKKEDKKDKEVGGDIGEKEGGRATDGQIINLISVDVFRVSEIAAYLHFVAITAPILIILSLYMLWRVLGWSGLAGMSVLVASIPIQTLSARLFLRVQEKLLEATDKRLTLFSEVLSAMKTVKFFAWERSFEARMEATRKHELKMLRNRYLAWIAQFVTFFMTPMLVATVTFTVHTQVLHKPLPAETAFTALALFGIMRAPIDQLPDMIVNVLSALTSVRRIDKFLREEETPKYEQLLGAQQETTSDDPVIGFQDATFSFAEGGPDAVSGGANTAAAPGSGAGGDGEAEPAETFSLKDLNLTFPLGELSIIGGPVGSGKTMMLLSLLGETHQVSGRIFAPCPVARAILPKDPHTGLQESIAYCSQNPWLLSTTIRDNILFGQEMDQERYREVLFACALEVDLVVLEFGDSTECGEAGVTLSGGQKARVALARALYSPARYLYLDDILSAVDAHTAKHLYTHCLKGKLMQGRTVIMVTHAISLCLPGAAFAVALQDGKVAAAGKPADLMAAGVFEEEGAHGSDDEDGGKVGDEIVEDVAEELDEEGNARSGKKAVTSSHPAGPKRAVDPEELAKKLSVEKSNKTEEGYAKGSVSLSTYRTYFLSLDPRPWVVFIFWLILLAFFFTARISDVTAAAWLRRWASTFEQYKESAWETLSTLTAFAGPSRLSGLAPSNIKALPWNIKHHAQNVSESILTVVGQESIVHESMAYTVPSQFVLLGEDAKFSPSFSSFKASFVSKESGSLDYLKIYVALSLLFVILSLARDIWCYAGSLQASKHVYRRFISALMHATPSFFEKTPHGRIVNRASKDVEALDQEMSGSVLFFSEMVLQTVTIFGIVIWANPFFSIIGVFILVAFFAIGALYLGSARDLKRIESVTRSPIYSLIGEVLSGSVVIRAYADSGRFARHTLRLIDGTNRPFYMLWLANRWLSIRVDSMAALTAVCTALFMILNPRVDAGLAGFTLSYTIQLVDTVLWTVRMYSQVEITANSVERIEEYLNLESEKMGGTEPPAYWPSSTGDIEIDNLSVRYGPEFPRALDGIKLKIKAGQSIAICGRTGSGKSTLSLAFFRFLEAEAGSIIIDGLDIAQVPLRTLRKRLTIIPQDAQLFSGTIRQNLDPFGEYEDSELWMALIKCRLASVNTPMASRAASQPASRPTSRPASIRHSAKPATAAPAASNGKLAAREEPAANGDDESEQSESEIQTIHSLDATVESGGKNFSAGQRQLIALARGLLKLRDSRILILDESTANLDSASDAAVQRTIRTEMAPNATVITIAHRLRTLADHDLVAVLGRGKLLEYDTPANLIRDPKSNFYELCQKSGASEFEVLKEMAFAKEAESKAGASASGSGSAA
ncbi:Transporter of the ATP-binding cassette (ABC) [Tilletia horrida]|uniref:Transporter of the ATP-binding cassette (ABC) n=1 Tax=Tilletia horrida TaxID=155126 RepID=A0AAN6GU66_9BASI|nr:Transporter of the ATP-binding cassette (ABC) [Tilletia horrida]KAK0556379.1 Transporter of the ATP-binding cassette (ABC) [Tilletia horrida]KAK0569279.1 Transporter of the ATP-binding cassette (ABC) [Tilletia horrida]